MISCFTARDSDKPRRGGPTPENQLIVFKRVIVHTVPLRSMASIFRWGRLFKKSPWKPLGFDNANFETLRASQVFEEERYNNFSKGRYYPVQIGQVLDMRYQVVGKLGFGLGSTVWLARDLQ